MRNIFIIAKGVIRELLRRKDFYLIFTLLAVIMLYSSAATFGGESGFYRYFKELGISLAYLFSVIIAVTFAARQIPQETEEKTIYPILAHPVSRAEFIIGKFTGAFLISVISFSLFYVAFIIALAIRKDFTTPWPLFVEGYFLHVMLLAFFTALTVCLSLFLSASANTGIVLILYFAFNWFGANMPGYIYLPHTELFDIKERIVHSWDLVPFWVMSFLAAYAFLYTAFFLALACLTFRKRDL